MAKDFSLQDSITKKRKKKSKGMVMKNIETKYILKSLLAQLANIDTLKKKKKKQQQQQRTCPANRQSVIMDAPKWKMPTQVIPYSFFVHKKKTKVEISPNKIYTE